MSTVRNLLEYLGFSKSAPLALSKVSPSKSLLVCSMPCEVKAAVIRNKAVDEVQAENIGEVSYRFLQTKRGENVTLNETLVWGVSSVIAFKLLCGLSPSFLILMLPYVLHVPPNIMNYLRYSETRQHTEEWLNHKLGSETLQKIKKLKYNNEGMFKLATILRDVKINPPGYHSIREEKRLFDCWNMNQ